MRLLSAADASHFRSLLQLLSSVRWFEPAMAVTVYDLGFEARQAALLRSKYPECELVAFPFSEYPTYFDIRVRAGEYAWKPIIVWESIRRWKERVCWMDSGNVLIARLDELQRALDFNGFYSPYSPGTIGQWTHPKTLEYFGLAPSWGAGLRNLNGACIAFDPDREKALELAGEWRDGALIKDCIAPAGSDRSNHRQDQALLTVLAYRKGMVEGIEHSYLGYKIHQDVESHRVRAVARRLKRALEYYANHRR